MVGKPRLLLRSSSGTPSFYHLYRKSATYRRIAYAMSLRQVVGRGEPYLGQFFGHLGDENALVVVEKARLFFSRLDPRLQRLVALRDASSELSQFFLSRSGYAGHCRGTSLIGNSPPP